MALLRPSALAVALVLSACASSDGDTVAPVEDAGPRAERQEDGERRELTQKRELLRAKLAVAQRELQLEEDQHARSLQAAEAEVALAQAALEHFDAVERPARTAEAELSLRSTKDRAQEAADELAQIELMYEEQDLDDRTAEFVVSRGRRNAERAARRIEIEELRLAGLVERELPMEHDKLRLAVERAEAKLGELRADRDVATRRKELELREMEYELEDVERDLAEAKQ